MNLNNFFIKTEDELIKIELDEVYYFTKQNNKVLVVLKNKSFELNASLYNISNLLAKNPSFIRTHKSFIVNQKKIKSISKYTEKTYNIKFYNIDSEAYITAYNLKLLKENSLIL